MSKRKVVIVSAHPDDETLGAGGTLLKHKQKGDELYWIIATSIFETQGYSKERIAKRKEEIDIVAAKYGFLQVFNLGYPTMSLSASSVITMVPEISKIFLSIEPEIIYLINRSDAHSDHRYLFDSVVACTKSFRYPFIKQVLMYECISETEFAPALSERLFMPNYFIDITEQFNEKISILNIFESEIHEHPFPRSLRNVEALAIFRGATVGVKYAEAFQLIKFIEK
ncbi:PIG-L family deacetylase [Sediminibacterium sp. KACHI17]|uniref:PIG-L family deacetylase n=1 Tax=Sediminibacterium sp. KACHI17 TaxID=1751071 RepID=A0AAT9GIC3_9BACT